MSKRSRTTDGTATLASTFEGVRNQLEQLLAPLLAATKDDGLLTQLCSNLQTECRVVEDRLQGREAAHLNDRDALEREVAQMKVAAGQMAEVVKLNVGGRLFTTSRTTLVAQRGFLAAMFSGRHTMPLDAEGAVFIDRDPKHFDVVLNFLRSAQALLPDSPRELQELALEAEYYQLEGLLDAINGRGRFERELGEVNLATRNRENEVRRLFAQEPESAQLLVVHLDLIEIFANKELFVPAADPSWQQLHGHMMMRDEDYGYLDRITLVPMETKPLPRLEVASSVCPSLAQFKDTFKTFTDGVFEGFDSSNVLIAGGSVLAGLLFCPKAVKPNKRLLPWNANEAEKAAAHAEYDAAPATVPTLGSSTMKQQQKAFFRERYFEQSDVDFFLWGLTSEQATQKIRQIYSHLRKKGDTTIVRSKLAVTFIQDFPRRVVQVVLRLYKSPAEILAGFDVDACCVAYDGNRVWATRRSARALNGMVNVVDPSRQSKTYERRLYKYSLRGFGVCTPGFDARRVDFSRLWKREIGEVHGMARLLMLERLTDVRSSCNLSQAKCKRGIGVANPNSVTKLSVLHKSNWTNGERRASTLRMARIAVADPAPESDYAGYVVTPKKGFHPFGMVSLFVQGAHSGKHDIPIVAARNNMGVILDAGGTQRKVEMKCWDNALAEEIFPRNAAIHDAGRQFGSGQYGSGDITTVTYTPSIDRFIEYVAHDAGRQMIGSFHPIDSDFFADCYNR